MPIGINQGNATRYFRELNQTPKIVMKTLYAFIVNAIVFVPFYVQAQGTTYFSGMGIASQGNYSIGSNSWGAAWFQTGNSPGGYSLNSISLLMGNSVGSPSGFSVRLWNFQTQQPVLTLTGSNPTTSGIYTFTAPSFAMGLSQVYWFVVTSQTSIATGAYNWLYSNQLALGNAWQGGGYNVSSDGVNWTRDGGREFQFAVNATAVPEPTALALLGLSAGLVVLAHKKRRPIQR